MYFCDVFCEAYLVAAVLGHEENIEQLTNLDA